MNKLKILIEGYARPVKDDTYMASPTSVLIESENKKILVDPGANHQKLKAALNKEGYSPEDIDMVFLSHYHPDHFLAIRLFKNHDVIDGETIWSEDIEIEHGSKTIPETDIEIMPTPGHSSEHHSLLVETKEKGIVCVAQDVFWWEDGKQKSDTLKDLMELKDPFASDEEELERSRRKVLDIADWIIPGHGRIFKNPQKN